jgi:maltooligosyltrehalose trehalohydrolase
VDGRRFVTAVQTHDQVGNRALGERLSALAPLGRCAAAAALLLLSPFTPMLFMGEEWGASTPWLYFTDHQDPELGQAVTQGRRREMGHQLDPSLVPDPQRRSTFAESKLDWSELESPSHAGLLEWYRTLIRLRREYPELAGPRLGEAVVTRDRELVTVQRGPFLLACDLDTGKVRVTDRAGSVIACYPSGA